MKAKQVAGGTNTGQEYNVPSRCDICQKTDLTEVYDGATKTGPWGWMCKDCFEVFGRGLGTGLGQKYEKI